LDELLVRGEAEAMRYYFGWAARYLTTATQRWWNEWLDMYGDA